jgi:hypothetical protein
MAFDTASVKQNKSGLPPSGDMPKSNFPLGPGDLYYPNGGLFTATNLSVHSPIGVSKITYTALASTRTVLAWAALGSSMLKMPSFKVALAFEPSTSAGR